MAGDRGKYRLQVLGLHVVASVKQRPGARCGQQGEAGAGRQTEREIGAVAARGE